MAITMTPSPGEGVAYGNITISVSGLTPSATYMIVVGPETLYFTADGTGAGVVNYVTDQPGARTFSLYATTEAVLATLNYLIDGN